MARPILDLLGRFVSSRFLLLPTFCFIYYLQLELLKNFPRIRSICLLLLIGILGLAIPANYFWIIDFRKRLVSGFDYLNAQAISPIDDKDALEQMRWCNVQVLGIIIIILSILAQYQYVSLISAHHRVPVLALVLLILVALFDAALDLQAEWIISALSGIKRAEAGKVSLPSAIWKVNQYPKARVKLYRYVLNSEVSEIGFTSFTAGAQNMISFAIIIVSGLASIIIVLLWIQLRSIPGNLVDYLAAIF